jgi:hypothetical protein
MSYLEWLVQPSSKIKEPFERMRARFLSMLLIGRGFGLLGIAALFMTADYWGLQPIEVALEGGLFFNLVAYGVSRTKNFRFAAYLIILESMFGVPYVIYRVPVSDVIAAAPYWLSLGTLISSLVLPTRQTIFFTFTSALGFLFMAFVVPPTSLPLLGATLIYFFISSMLAAIGSAMRDTSERTIQAESRERRGPPAEMPKRNRASGE